MALDRFAPVWLFVVNALLQKLHWDWWSEVGREIKENFWVARMRSLGFTFVGSIDGKGLEKSAGVATGSEKNADGATDLLQEYLAAELGRWHIYSTARQQKCSHVAVRLFSLFFFLQQLMS